jgi:hypothetical protein
MVCRPGAAYSDSDGDKVSFPSPNSGNAFWISQVRAGNVKWNGSRLHLCVAVHKLLWLLFVLQSEALWQRSRPSDEPVISVACRTPDPCLSSWTTSPQNWILSPSRGPMWAYLLPHLSNDLQGPAGGEWPHNSYLRKNKKDYWIHIPVPWWCHLHGFKS